MIKIIVAGFKGRMGSTATQMVLETADFELVGVYDPHEAQETVSFNDETAIPVFQRLEEVLAVKPDVWIDFMVPIQIHVLRWNMVWRQLLGRQALRRNKSTN